MTASGHENPGPDGEMATVRPMTDLKKRMLAVVMAAAMVFTFAACSDDADSPTDDAPQVGS